MSSVSPLRPAQPLPASVKPASVKSEPTQTTEKKADEELSHEDNTPKKNPEMLQQEKADQYLGWVKKRAELLSKISDKTAVTTESTETASSTRMNSSALKGNIHVKSLANDAIELTETFAMPAIDIGLLNTELDVHLDPTAGLGYAMTGGKQVLASINFMGAQWQLNTLKAEKENIQQTISQLPENHVAMNELVAQKKQVEIEIAKHEQTVNETGFNLLKNTVENGLQTITDALSYSTETAGVAASYAGGAVLGTVTLAQGSVEIAKGIHEHRSLENQAVNIERVNEKHEKPNVSAAMTAIKTLAIDRVASHQKQGIELGIFQGAMTVCQSAAVVALSLIGAIVGAAALTTLAPVLPVIGAVGLLAAGGVAVYNHRQTLHRGIKGLVDPGTERGRISPDRNLRYREWSRQRELKGTIKNLDKLAQKELTATNQQEKHSYDVVMQHHARKVVKLSSELEDIRYKRAAQTLKDETRGPEKAKQARIEAMHDALIDIHNELTDMKKNLQQLNDPVSTIREKTYQKLNKENIKNAEKEMRQIDKKIQQLSSTPESHDEIDQLKELKLQIIENISPSQKNIEKFREEYTDKFVNLHAEGIALKEKRDLLKEDKTPAESPVIALENAIKNLDATELKEFITLCGESFPGIDFQQLDAKEDKKIYIITQVHRAIASESLFG